MEPMVSTTAVPADALSLAIEVAFPGDVRIAAAFDVPRVPAGITILFGPSGAGKTTLLRVLAGLERSARGRIRFGDEIWLDSPNRVWVTPQHRRLGYLFQDYALFPHLTVAGNIAFGLRSLPRKERRSRAEDICSRLGLEGLEERRPGELSGGQRQRVALARVLVCRPGLLLLDEPFGALDESTREDVRGYLLGLLRETRIPAIVVTHDWIDALSMGDQMIVLNQGQVVQRGTPQEVLTRPASREVAAIAGVDTVVPGVLSGRDAGVLDLAVGNTRLVGLDPGGAAEAFWVCIRGEDVTLEHGSPGRSSARNHLPGTVRELLPRGAVTKVVVDVGFRLVALITRQAVLDLGLEPGMRVSAVFKASTVHLVEKPRSRLFPP